MDTNVVQELMDRLVRVMLEKGLRIPDAQAHIEANAGPLVFLRWSEYGQPDYCVEVLRDPDIATAITNAFTLVENLPGKSERDRAEFTSLLANVIDKGRSIGIEVDYLNPLTEMMKRLSENAITH